MWILSGREVLHDNQYTILLLKSETNFYYILLTRNELTYYIIWKIFE